MIVVRLMGGLGNQMFQYAAGKALALYHNVPLKVDVSFLEDNTFKPDFTYREFELNCFNAEIEIAPLNEVKKFVLIDSLIKKALNFFGFYSHRIFLEKSFNFDISFYSTPPNSLLIGYWQSEKYFSNYRELILKEFSWKNSFSHRNMEIFKEISSSNSVSIHIRRGDYISNSAANNFHGICEMDYYINAIKLIESRVKNPKYFIFSDDLEIVKEEFKNQISAEYIDWNFAENSFEDMRLMSCCKNNIIANSSFSWWAAWLNQNPNKIVVAPKKWFKKSDIDTSDLFPSYWILL